MPIVEYTPKMFGDLSEMVTLLPWAVNLAHRPFVDYYYATSDCCKLYVYYSDSGKVLGTLGRELAPFECDGRELRLRIASNWYSLRHGVGGKLSLHSAQSCPESVGLTFTGSCDTIAILKHHKWIFMPGIQGYVLNNPYRVRSGEPFWRRTTKSAMRQLTRKKISSFADRIPADVSAEVEVQEEFCYEDDLLPERSAFRFRLAPQAGYLNWRYNLSLPYIRYRVFRVIRRGASCGYVIVSDSPKQIIVAQCDGDDAATLAYGVLLSILEVGSNDDDARTVFLTCSHREMQEIFQKFGFRGQKSGDLPFAFRRQPPQVETSRGTSRETSDWLVNFDWGDNGVRPPFRSDAEK
jgi:hypothetical protein